MSPSNAETIAVLIPSAMRAASEIILLIQRLKQQSGLTDEELFARADAQTQQNRADIRAFLEKFGR